MTTSTRPRVPAPRTSALSAWWPASLGSLGLHTAIGVVCAGWIVGGGGIGSGAAASGAGDEVVFELRIRPRSSAVAERAERAEASRELVADAVEPVANVVERASGTAVDDAPLVQPVVVPVLEPPHAPRELPSSELVAVEAIPSPPEPVAAAGEQTSSAALATTSAGEPVPSASPRTPESTSSSSSAASVAPVPVAARPAAARPRSDRTSAIRPAASSATESGGEPGAPVGETRAAALVDGPSPDYPRESELRGEHGVVLCTIHVAADGSVTRVEISRTSGFARLDRAAIDGLKRWRFRPALHAGRAIASQVKHSVSFVFE